MDRKELANFTHNQVARLNVSDPTYKQWVFRYTFLELEKDLGSRGDLTTKSVFTDERVVKAKFVAKACGVLAGLEEIKYFLVDSDAKFRPSLKGDFKLDFFFKDGDIVQSGDIIFEIEAEIHDLLAVERVVLNLLVRMSGVATFTRRLVEMVGGLGVFLAATRKTLWGWLDKKAVSIGGGFTHRLNLSDSVIVKDTHLDVFGRDLDLLWGNLLKAKLNCRFVEVEVETVDEALKMAALMRGSLDSGELKSVPVIMLDNFASADICSLIEKVKLAGLYDGILFEASGGISEKNLLEYAETGVDIVSMGCLTSWVKGLDVSMKIV